MKRFLFIMGCISFAVILTNNIMLGAGGKSGSGMEKKTKAKQYGWIGVMIQDVDEKIIRKQKLDSEEGAYIKEVVEESPADLAGVQERDVIIEFNGKKIFDSDDLVRAVRRTPPNTKVNLVLLRSSEKKTLQLVVGRNKEHRHGMFRMPQIPDVKIFISGNVLGLRLITLNEQLGGYFNTPNNEGVLVEEVEENSAAEKAGFKAGDVIIRAGKRNIDTAEKIRRELRKYDDGDMVEFEIIRKNEKMTLKVEYEEKQFMPDNIVIPKPHIQMFRGNILDDAKMFRELDELLPDIEQMQKSIEDSMNNLEELEHVTDGKMIGIKL
ncbi:MAG: PDZ domain-containing protein [Bacteroidetes bacterium]|nr:PDZ domain-containing protein [Bacteroidota bacterium]